jgi:hypothetical protein
MITLAFVLLVGAGIGRLSGSIPHHRTAAVIPKRYVMRQIRIWERWAQNGGELEAFFTAAERQYYRGYVDGLETLRDKVYRYGEQPMTSRGGE